MSKIKDRLKNLGRKVRNIVSDAVSATKTNLRHLDDSARNLVDTAVSATKTNLKHLNRDLKEYLPIAQRLLNAYKDVMTQNWVALTGDIIGGTTQSNIKQLENLKHTWEQIQKQERHIPPPKGTEYKTRDGKTWVKPAVYDDQGNLIPWVEPISVDADIKSQINQGYSDSGNQAIQIATAVKVDTQAIADVMDQQVYAIQDLEKAILQAKNNELTQATIDQSDIIWNALHNLSIDSQAATLTTGSMVSDAIDREVQVLTETSENTLDTIWTSLTKVSDTVSDTMDRLIGTAMKPIGLFLENIGTNIWESLLSVFFEQRVD